MSLLLIAGLITNYDNNNMIVNTMGASGAEYLFAQHALKSGIKVEIVSFHDHIRIVPEGDVTIREINYDDLYSITADIVRCACELGRFIYTSKYSKNILHCMWFTVIDADAVIIVGTLRKTSRGIHVEGDEGWAAQLFIQASIKRSANPPMLWLLDQDRKQWMRCMGQSDWRETTAPKQLSKFGRIAVVGTRDVNYWAAFVIRNIVF